MCHQILNSLFKKIEKKTIYIPFLHISGHLAKDCFHIPGGQSYDLLPEEDYTSQLQARGFGKGSGGAASGGGGGGGGGSRKSSSGQGFGDASLEQQVQARNFGKPVRREEAESSSHHRSHSSSSVKKKKSKKVGHIV